MVSDPVLPNQAAAVHEHSDRHDTSQNEVAKGHEVSHEGAHAYRGRRGAGHASEMATCVENNKLNTILHSQIKQQQ